MSSGDKGKRRSSALSEEKDDTSSVIKNVEKRALR
jgi:hypothetical protein